MANPLAKLERSYALLAEASTVVEAIDIRDKAAAAAHYCKAAKLGGDHLNRAAELKLRAERKAGQLLDSTVERGRPRKGSTGEPFLSDLGVTKKESHRWQAIATVPSDEFEAYLEACRDGGKEIRSSEMIRRGQRIKREAKKASAEPAEAVAVESSNDWEILNGDVMVGLNHILESGQRARLAFADPPYNIGIDYGEGSKADQLDDGEYMQWAREWLGACRDCLTDDGSMWVMINDEYAAEYAIVLKSLGLVIRNWIKWYEAFGVNCSNKFNRTSRHIFYCIKDPKRFVFNREAVTRPSDRQTKYGDKRAAEGGKIWDDVWQIPRLFGTAVERLPGFPTQLPLALVRPIVECASNVGDLVIDPFNGSGTTGVAAIETARRYIGIELSEEFAKRARVRLSHSQMPILEAIQ